MKGTVTMVEQGKTPAVKKGTTKVSSFAKLPQNGEAQMPVQKPGAGVIAQQLNSADSALRKAQTATQATNDADDYKSINEQIWGDNGGGSEAYEKQVEQGTRYQAYSDAELAEKTAAAGIDPTKMNSYSQKGGYTQTGGSGTLPGTGEEGWTYQSATARSAAEGTSGADEEFLSDASYEYVQYCRQQYAAAQSAEEKAYWHSEAEKIRARAGYSGGADGSMYIPVEQLGGGQSSGISGGSSTPEGRLNELLDAWKQAAEEQAATSIDYAVQQAILEYEAMSEEAQAQFKEQAESVSRDERQALDSAALYAELRGDKGGIGEAQYSSILNAAAQNRLAVQQAQTMFSTNMAKEIENLRLQGEFEKADATFEIAQEYLAQLMSLEQWAAEYEFSTEQFQEQLKQWEAEYTLKLGQMQLAQEQWEQEFAFSQQQAEASDRQWWQQFEYEKYLDSAGLERAELDRLAEAGWAMLNMGVMPDETYLAVMGLDWSSAKRMVNAIQQKDTGGVGSYYPDLRDYDLNSILNLGIGMLNAETIDQMVAAGTLDVTKKGEKNVVQWAENLH